MTLGKKKISVVINNRANYARIKSFLNHAKKKKNIDHREKLLGWLINQYKKETVALDDTVWAFYNALTNWATHPELYDYKEDSKFYNIEESNKNQVFNIIFFY